MERFLLLAACFLALPINQLLAKGEKIVLYLKTGQQMICELHSVSDSSLVVYKRKEGTPQLFEVKSREIGKVTFKSKPKVVLFLKDGQRVTGGLREVNDSTMVINDRKLRDPQNYNSAYVESDSEIKNHEIRQIIIRGKKNAGKGAIIGFGLGFLAGTVSGFAEGDDPPCPPPPKPKNIFEWFVYPIVGGIATGLCESYRETAAEKAGSRGLGGGLGGLTIGWIAGKATSTRDKEIEFSAQQPFAILKPLALRKEPMPKK